MDQKARVDATSQHVEEVFSSDKTGHDWWHILRVRNMAVKIGHLEGADIYITEMAALLHDLDDWKLSDGLGLSNAEKWLDDIQEPIDSRKKILETIDTVSFKGAKVDTTPSSLEGKVVQDADRLDALGAIGIARAFAFGGNRQRSIYNPGVSPTAHESFEAYQKDEGHTINHFYEKLLLLKDRMQTATGKKFAIQRHAFMQVYLDQFFEEWKGTL